MIWRFLLVLRKEFIQIRRDSLSLKLLVLMPIAQLLIMGYALNKDIKHLHLSIWDQDRTVLSQDWVQTTSASPIYLELQNQWTTDPQSLRRGMDARQLDVGVVLPPHFDALIHQNLYLFFAQQNTQPVAIQVILNGQDANSASLGLGYLQEINQNWIWDLMQKEARHQGLNINSFRPIHTQSRILFNPELESSWYMIPGIAVILVTIVCALLSSFSIVKEKENGTMEQLMSTPLGVFELLMAKVLPYFILGYVELFAVLGMGVLIFHLPMHANLQTLILFCGLYMLAILGIGILVSSVVQSQQQALFLVWFFLIFCILTSGFLLPWENMPDFLKWITEVNPLRFQLVAMRESLLKGTGIHDLINEAIHLVAMALGFFAMALLSFQRQGN